MLSTSAQGKRILIVLTSHDRLGDTGKKTGFSLRELVVPYYVLLDAGAESVLASPAGGRPPIAPGSLLPEARPEAIRRFERDGQAMDQLAATVPLASVSEADFDAVYYPGGRGPLWDLVADADSIRLIRDFWRSGKPVAAICHGPIALINVTNDDGEYIVAGREVTGFSNSEEALESMIGVLPLSVEDALVERGGRYSKAGNYESHVRRDGMLITGQNPASSTGVAKEILAALGWRRRVDS